MCYASTAFRIKALVAFCFCVNTLNFTYLIIRSRTILPKEVKDAKEAIESVLPRVKNIDKYVPKREGTIFLCSLAAISIVFDLVLYEGVENDQYCMILSAWIWGIVDCSFDFVVGIASGNMTFMDAFEMTQIEYRYTKTDWPCTTPPPGTETPPSPNTETPPLDRTETPATTKYRSSRKIVRFPGIPLNETEYAKALMMPKKKRAQPVRPTPEQTTVLIIYVIFRLLFKTVALAGIKQYSAQLAIDLRLKKQGLGTMATLPSLQ